MPTTELREVVNAILYVARTGMAWRYLPQDFPPHTTVYGYFRAWKAINLARIDAHLTHAPRARTCTSLRSTSPRRPVDRRGEAPGPEFTDDIEVSGGSRGAIDGYFSR